MSERTPRYRLRHRRFKDGDEFEAFDLYGTSGVVFDIYGHPMCWFVEHDSSSPDAFYLTYLEVVDGPS